MPPKNIDPQKIPPNPISFLLCVGFLFLSVFFQTLRTASEEADAFEQLCEPQLIGCSEFSAGPDTTFPLHNQSRFTQGLSCVASETFGWQSRDPAAAHQTASLFHCFLDLKNCRHASACGKHIMTFFFPQHFPPRFS